MDEAKKYLRSVLPRLYEQTEAWCKVEFPELLPQLPHLIITGRCSCGNCSDFTMDSELPELSKRLGSEKLSRPFYREMGEYCPFYIGLSTEDDVGNISPQFISSYELSGGDYPDNYIHEQLETHGFMR